MVTWSKNYARFPKRSQISETYLCLWANTMFRLYPAEKLRWWNRLMGGNEDINIIIIQTTTDCTMSVFQPYWQTTSCSDQEVIMAEKKLGTLKYVLIINLVIPVMVSLLRHSHHLHKKVEGYLKCHIVTLTTSACFKRTQENISQSQLFYYL